MIAKDGLKIIPLKKKLRLFFIFFFIHFKNLQELRIMKWKREYSSLQALIFFNYFECMKIIYVNYGFKEMNIQAIFVVMDAT